MNITSLVICCALITNCYCGTGPSKPLDGSSLLPLITSSSEPETRASVLVTFAKIIRPTTGIGGQSNRWGEETSLWLDFTTRDQANRLMARLEASEKYLDDVAILKDLGSEELDTFLADFNKVSTEEEQNSRRRAECPRQSLNNTRALKKFKMVTH